MNIRLLPSLLFACSLFALAALPAYSEEQLNKPEPGLEISIKQKTLFNSHTSYQFGNPVPPYQQPLSKLEFPVDSVWGGLEVRKQISRFSVGVDFLTSVTDQETGRFKDSDWAEESNTAFLTNYGETSCRLEPSYQVGADIDMQVADLLRLPKEFNLRPVLGFRWQQFSLMAHDGIQYDYDISGLPPDILDLPGNTIAFEQTWYQYFLGARVGYEWRSVPWLYRIKLQTQMDWSYVEGYNRDHHLLRAGNRITEEETTGDAWHAVLSAVFGITRNLDLGIEADYLKIETTGTHTLNDSNFSLSWSNGVKVWSEQYGMSVKLGYRF